MKMHVHLSIFFAALSLAGTTLSKSSDNSKRLQYEVVVQDSYASAMMLGLANQNTAFIFDKVEDNKHRTGSGKPTWASMVNLDDNSVRGVDATTNPFCAGGINLGNGSYIVVGGNSAVNYGGGGVKNQDGSQSPGPFAPYQDYDGRRVVRLMEPNEDSSKLTWIDEYNSPNQMDSPRWYPAVEGLPDGSAVLIGGATNGGFINRNYPNVDPAYATESANPNANDWEQGGANPSYEFWPPTNKPKPAVHDFMVKTSGLNMYAHTYLLPSGRIFMQANYSTTMWDWQNDKFDDLPDMPDRVVRVYPASGATAMLPLTPANKYTPTILFCGGFNNMTDEEWGDYTAPRANVYERAASTDCSSITPEHHDGTTVQNVQYEREDKLPEPRSMGQFIHLPTGQLVIVNGASRGLAGFGNTTWNTVKSKDGKTVRLEGMSQDPTYRPVLYDPEQPKGRRLDYASFGKSKIARLYHSSAILIPDGSVLVAGSNPHVEPSFFNNDDIDSQYEAFNTTYAIEKWYPSYYFEPRPKPKGLPDVIKYGGESFNITIDKDYMNPNKNANAMANRTKIMLIRPGFSTHAVNFGQRSLQLDNSFVVHDDGSVTFIVNPMPTNMNIFVPGPALLFVTVNGVPSHGKYIMVGEKNPGAVPFNIKPGNEPAPLPKPVTNSQFTNQAPRNSALSSSGDDDNDGLSGGAIAGIVIGVIAGIAVLAGLGFYVWRAKRNQQNSVDYAAMGRAANRRSNRSGDAEMGRAPTWAAAPSASGDTSRMPMMQANESNVSLAENDFAPPHTNSVYTVYPMSSKQNNPVSSSTLDIPSAGFASPQASTTALHPESTMMVRSGTDTTRTVYRDTPDSARGPVLMPEQPTQHWNDAPPRLQGPRALPQSNLQQHLMAARQRSTPTSE